MASIWRTFTSAKKKHPKSEDRKKKKKTSDSMDVSIPTHFCCPISLDLMKDPVMTSTGITYDRHNIEAWLDMGNTTCPITSLPITSSNLIPNHSIRKMIQDWCVANRSLGFDRIPTPRTPLSEPEAIRMLSEIDAAAQKGNYHNCLRLVIKLKDLARESERNKQCIASNGASRILASSFATLTRSPGNSAVVEEILSAMASVLPLDNEACADMAKPESVRSLVAILRYGDLAGRLNAAVLVKELLHPSKAIPDGFADTEGLIEALVELIREPISPRATKAALVSAFYMISASSIGAEKFVELGLVHLALEILVDTERSMAEKALGVIDGLCGLESGRRSAGGHALAVPVLVKKMLRVSDMATQFAVSALWKLCRDGSGTRWLDEAVQVGAFQKLLLLLQVGCGDGTKEKVKEMLKLLNSYEGKSECVESADFKGLKRAF